MGRYGLTYGKSSLLPYLIGKFQIDASSRTKLEITIQPSTGSGLIILGFVYIIAATAIYMSWINDVLSGVIIGILIIIGTYISITAKFNMEKDTYINFIEKEILKNNSVQ